MKCHWCDSFVAAGHNWHDCATELVKQRDALRIQARLGFSELCEADELLHLVKMRHMHMFEPDRHGMPKFRCPIEIVEAPGDRCWGTGHIVTSEGTADCPGCRACT